MKYIQEEYCQYGKIILTCRRDYDILYYIRYNDLIFGMERHATNDEQYSKENK